MPSAPDLKVIFFGTPKFVVPVLEELCKNFRVVATVTAKDQKVGRQQTLTKSEIKVLAEKLNIPVLSPEKLDQDFIECIKGYQPDLIVVASYGAIIPQEVLDLPRFGSLNIHPSLLPKYRGASPIPSAILAGDSISGITIIKMDAQMDHGPIVATEDFRLSNQDNFDTLSKKMFEAGVHLIIRTIPGFIAGKIDLKPQDDAKATFCSRIKKEDGYFDINNRPTPIKLDHMIRAYFPWPTVWTRWNGKIIKFLPQNLVQMEGKKPTLLEDFLRGYPNFPIKQLQ